MIGTQKLYLDIDGVIADFISHLFNYLNLPNHPVLDWNDTRIRENFHLIANDPGFWLTIPPMNQDLNISPDYYITSRPIQSSISRLWLRRNKFPAAEVITVGHDVLKSPFVIPGSLVIDDAPHNYYDLHTNGIMCYLMDAPYNQHVETEYRIYHPNDILLV